MDEKVPPEQKLAKSIEQKQPSEPADLEAPQAKRRALFAGHMRVQYPMAQETQPKGGKHKKRGS